MSDLKAFKAKTRDLLLEAERSGLLESQDCLTRLQGLDRADRMEDIEGLVTDLVEVDGPSPGQGTLVLADSPLKLSVVMGEQRFWPAQLSRYVHFRCIMASAALDYRNALFPPGESTLELKVVMGDAEILLPPGITVKNQVAVVMADVQSPGVFSPPTNPGSVIILKGKVVMGSLRIRIGAPGSTLSL